MATLPTILGPAGLLPQPPATIRARLIALVSATNPGYTADLPGSLIEDLASTEVAGVVLSDQARVDLVNSLTPYGANAFLLKQQGNIYGVQIGLPSNTSVFVIFSGPPGFVIAKGFVVSDGTFQYTVQDGGVIGTDSRSDPLFCLATTQGSWPVPPGNVNQIATSVPIGITLNVTNPLPGTPGLPNGESEESYRARVLQAGLAASQGMARYLKTLLADVEGVQPRLISVLQQEVGGWEIIVGGGDPYEVAYAIYTALFDISTLVPSQILALSISNANPGVITTNINHGFITGQVVVMQGATGMTGVNGVPLIATVLSERSFSIGINTTFSGIYTGGGVLSPNQRNIVVSIADYPNSYQVVFVNPPQQTVTIHLSWNTSSPNFVSAAAVAQLGSAALVDYVNSVAVGQPMILYELQAVFQQAIAAVVAPQLLTRMAFSVAIDGVGTPPQAGTGIIAGDPESFFFCQQTDIAIVQN